MKEFLLADSGYPPYAQTVLVTAKTQSDDVVARSNALFEDGKRLFAEGTAHTVLRLVDTKPVGPDGVLILTYQPAR